MPESLKKDYISQIAVATRALRFAGQCWYSERYGYECQEKDSKLLHGMN